MVNDDNSILILHTHQNLLVVNAENGKLLGNLNLYFRNNIKSLSDYNDDVILSKDQTKIYAKISTG